jgi:uncharacterized protein YbjT (DUF2867 family)
MKTAIVIGATGLVGNYITQKLLKNSRYQCVKLFVRRSFQIDDPKLEEHIVDFDKIREWKNQLIGDELYSALGTTIKKAGSKQAQYKIDFTYQYRTAELCSGNKVEKLLLVSSIGADENSKNFYLRMKGELDEAIIKLPFKQIFIFRPSILAGKRKEKRLTESIGINSAEIITKIIPALKKYRPIEAERVADAMIKSANQITPERVTIYESNNIFEF